MDFIFWFKYYAKELLRLFSPAESTEVVVKLTLEETLYSEVRTYVSLVKEKGFSTPEIRYQLIDRRNLATAHAEDLLKMFNLAFINISERLPTKRDIPIPRVIKLDDWLVDATNVPIDLKTYLPELLLQLDKIDGALEAYKGTVDWAHYVRKSSVFFEDAITLMQWYLEIDT